MPTFRTSYFISSSFHRSFLVFSFKNGLGLTQRRFYLFPSFFTDISVSHLFGPGTTPGHLNNDALGRTHDAIAAYDPTEHFTEIVSKCLLQSDYETYSLHVDTTSFSVSGKYDADFNSHEISITYGHYKDHRTGMKQQVLQSLKKNAQGKFT